MTQQKRNRAVSIVWGLLCAGVAFAAVVQAASAAASAASTLVTEFTSEGQKIQVHRVASATRPALGV